MKVMVVPAAQLSSDHMAAWSRFQSADPALANPFFRPEFTHEVTAARGDALAREVVCTALSPLKTATLAILAGSNFVRSSGSTCELPGHYAIRPRQWQ